MNLTLCVDMRGCPNRCRHCWLGHMPNGNMSDKEAENIVRAFGRYFDSISFYSWVREPDYFQDYRARWENDISLSTGRKPQRFELASFYKIAREPEYVKFLKDVGTKTVQLTLFGLAETTDKYIGRKGAFDEIIKATKILKANGITPRWQAFINNENKHEIVKLTDMAGDIPFFLHEGTCDGENEKLYDIRIGKNDIPEEVIPYFLDYAVKQDEKYWVSAFKDKTSDRFIPSNNGGDIVLNISSSYDVFFNFTHMRDEWKIGNLKADGIDIIYQRIVNEDVPALSAARNITIARLAEKYGNPDSERIFAEEDYLMYLLNRHASDCKTDITI